MIERKVTDPIFKLGDRVKIRYSDLRARVVELRGPLGPGGAQIYGIRIPGDPKSIYSEVREDQLILIPPGSKSPEKAKKNQKPGRKPTKIDWRKYLTSDPQVYKGHPCAKGTQVSVAGILDMLAQRASREKILSTYPSLRPRHIDAALAYAAELVRKESLFPLAEG